MSEPAVSRLAEFFTNQEVTRYGDKHSIDLGANQQFKVADIKRQKSIAPGSQRRNQHRLVFSSCKQERSLRSESIRHPIDLSAESRPRLHRRVPKFDDISGNFGAAIRGRNELPIMRAMNLPNEAGKRFFGSARGDDDTAIEEDPHFLPALSQKRLASRSSS